jgi:head-tail adaptor
MRGGALRNILTIQRLVQIGKTKLNDPITVWTDWRPDVFCDVEVKRGREHFADRKRYSEEIWRFRVRYDEVLGLDAKMRILHEGMTFDIKAPLPDGQRHSDIVIEATVQDSILGGEPLTLAIEDAINVARVGQAMDPFSISVSGGLAPYVLDMPVGELPPGVTFNISSGIVSGTPTAPWSAFLVFSATDAAGDVERLPEIKFEVI